MHRIKLLLLGDIHYPDESDIESHLDKKDAGFPRTLLAALGENRLATVARRISEVIKRDSELKGALLVGDLTSKGSIAGYERCVSFLQPLLLKTHSGAWPDSAIHIVPGNHDVDRKHPHGADVYTKFIPLRDKWGSSPRTILTYDKVRTTEIRNRKCLLQLLSLNSCVGCGELRLFPEEIRRALSHISDGDVRDKLIGEQLDTPLFVEDHVQEGLSLIQSLEPNTVPVLLAHHNLLPQTTPRVDIYTEAINAGLLRSRLTAIGRPIVFCHGHTHQDGVDLLADPTSEGSVVVIVSAPKFADGYVILSFEYNDSGKPQGLTVDTFKCSVAGIFSERPSTSIRVPFAKPRSIHSLDPGLVELVQSIGYGRFARVAEVISSFTKATGKVRKRKTIEHLLLQAEWTGCVSILNRTAASDQWQVWKTNP